MTVLDKERRLPATHQKKQQSTQGSAIMAFDIAGTDWRKIAADMRPDGRPTIDGKRVDAETDASYAVINPYSGATVASLPDCSNADVDRAVAAARRSFDSGVWANMPVYERGKILHRWAELVANDAELAVLETVQMGMPIAISADGQPGGAQLLDNCAELAERMQDLPSPAEANAFAMQVRRPHGVVGAITPWNFPLGTALVIIAPAIAAGNSVVLKPSEIAPLGCMRLADLALEAGLPEGVLNIVSGRGPTTGKALALHPDVDFLGFIGSTETGQLIMQYAGQSNLKGLLLECGGKTPQIVLDDLGDIEGLANGLFQGFTMNSGQVCTSGSRILVPTKLYDKLMPLLFDRVRAAQIGDPLDPATVMGPVATQHQCLRFEQALANLGEGDRLLAKGEATGHGPNALAPHLFEATSVDSPLVQEEYFGPMSVVSPYKDEADALRMANASRFGLSATLWSSDIAACHRMVRGLRTGFVLVNRVPTPKIPLMRFLSCEPFKMSGFGVQGGAAGLLSYTRLQASLFLMD
jgi:4-(gamma-glutamylamino)butanal dehydrogenase